MTKVIGLTGSIATGKTTVSNLLKAQGIPVIDADTIARELVKPNSPGLGKIVAAFGKDILLEKGTLNREKLGTLIFQSDKKRAQLDAIMQPLIRQDIMAQLEQAKKNADPIIVLDIPLLFETDYDKIVDEIIVVYIPRELQLIRLMERNHIKKDAAMKRINSQMSIDEKVKRGDIMIDNSGTITQTKRQVLKWLKEAIKLS